MRIKCRFLQDDEGVVWFHAVDKLLTRVKVDHVEDKLANGVTYWYRKKTKAENGKEEVLTLGGFQNTIQNLPEAKRKTHEEQIDTLALAMLKEFDDLKAQTEIMKEFEEVNDYQDTNNALKELYPDSEITIKDILHSKEGDLQPVMTKTDRSGSRTHPDDCNGGDGLKSKSMMMPYKDVSK